jgi:hypothetical protein
MEIPRARAVRAPPNKERWANAHLYSLGNSLIAEKHFSQIGFCSFGVCVLQQFFFVFVTHCLEFGYRSFERVDTNSPQEPIGTNVK